MKAWVLDSLGGLEKLRQVNDFPDPVAGPGEVVLELDFAALNPADRYLAEGMYPARPSFPHILGRDGIGRITSVGPGVSGFGIGDEYALLRGEAGVNRLGTFAAKVAVPTESLVPVPPGWSHEQAASATLVYITAYQALTQFGPLPDKAVVLITGATGGVGVASTQLARAMGCKVVGLSRSAEKADTLRKIGAAHTFDPTDTQWRKKASEALDGRKVDLAIDNIGGGLFSELLDTLGMNGRVSCVGRLVGPVPKFNTASLFFRRIQIRGVAVGTYTNAESHAAWDEVLKLLGKSKSKPLVDQVFEFDQLMEAFARLQAGPMGKVVLRI